MNSLMNRMDEIALMIALHPPEKRPASSNAYVPWYLIHALREEFESRGIDWRAIKAKRRAKEKST